MADGGQDFNLGHVVGSAGENGDDGSTVWNTSTAPTYANSKYTFNISNLSGKTGLEIAVNDIIFYSTYYYIVSAVNSTTVDCSTRVSIKGSDASVTIVDNLTTNDATKVLSAKQGKVLNDNKLEKTHSSYKGKNVVTNASTGTIEFEDKPTIPTKTSDLTNDGADGTNIFVSNNDSRLSDARTPSSHTHGQITNAGAITSTAVTVASGDNIVITDASDSSKIKRVANILSDHVKDGTAHTNIGSSASATQSTINSSIDTALGNKQATLVSGTNIKTVNNESLLGSGNITIQGGSNVDVVTSWEATLSDTKVPSEKLTKNSLDDKISKSTTAGLVKNDGTIDTTSYSTFSGSYNDLSNKPTIPSASTTTPSADTSSGSYGSGTSYARSNHSHPKSSLYAESSHTHTKSQITDFPSLSTVATSGSYSDLSNKPSIPSSSSDLSDGSDLIKKSSTTGLMKNDGTVMTSGTGSTNYSAGNHTHSGYISTSSTTGLVKNDGSIMTSGTGSSNYAAGNHTHSGYISTSSTTGLIKNDGTIMTSGTGSGNYAAGNHTHSGYVSTLDIADNLTTNDSTKVLSAKQGYQLNQLIGQAISYINQ